MLIVALVLAVIGLVALVAAVVTTNEVIAWVCIAASALGVVLLVIDAVRERQQRRLLPAAPPTDAELSDDTTVISDDTTVISDDTTVLSEDTAVIADEIAVEDHPEEVVHDEPEYDMPVDDEPDYPQAAEESAMHVVDENDER